MKKLKPFKSVFVATIICIILFFSGCYEFDFVIQPTSAEKNSSFEVQVSITTDSEGDGAEYYPYFGIKLPVGWTVQDSIAFTHLDGTGILVYSDSLVQEMNLIDPPEDGYYWWVSAGTEPVIYIDADTYLFNPIITTDSSTGTFFLDYMAGDSENNEYGIGLNRKRSDHHCIGVDLIENVVVTNSNDSGPGSLRQALNMVDFNGTVSFDMYEPDTIKLSSELEIFKNIEIAGPEEFRLCISGQNNTRIFHVMDTCFTQISNFDLIDGYEGLGGGVYCFNAGLILKNINISDCSAALEGGGLYGDFCSQIDLENVNFSQCTAGEQGGGFRIQFSPFSLDKVKISECSAELGGGLAIRYAELSGNFVTITSCSAVNGGGMYLDRVGFFLQNALLFDNSATSIGGAAYCTGTALLVRNVTVTGNQATHGGGFYNHMKYSISDMTAENSIIYDNYPTNIHLGTSSLYEMPSVYLRYCDLQDGVGGIAGIGDIHWLEGNIDEDPLFEGSGGHPYQLSAGSPCIDASNPDTTGLNLPMWDLMGNYRLWDGDYDGDTVVDMGAYEFGSVGVSTAEFKVPDSRFQVYCFPNPFYKIVHIEYEIENPSLVSIRVYNVIGEMVAVLQEGLLQDGKHRILWNAEGLTAGLYFCSMQIGQESITRKIIKH